MTYSAAELCALIGAGEFVTRAVLPNLPRPFGKAMKCPLLAEWANAANAVDAINAQLTDACAGGALVEWRGQFDLAEERRAKAMAAWMEAHAGDRYGWSRGWFELVDE